MIRYTEFSLLEGGTVCLQVACFKPDRHGTVTYHYYFQPDYKLVGTFYFERQLTFLLSQISKQSKKVHPASNSTGSATTKYKWFSTILHLWQVKGQKVAMPTACQGFLPTQFNKCQPLMYTFQSSRRKAPDA